MLFIGATSFQDLRTINGQVYETYKDTCETRGLLEDDGEWLQCLREAALMQTGSQLRNLFIIILLHCAPVRPGHLWEQTKMHLCDDLQYQLIHRLHMPEPTEEQVYDYGLYLIQLNLRKNGKHLDDFADMPRPHMDWDIRVGNQLIAEQLNYDLDQLHQIVENGVPTLNDEQRELYDAILDYVDLGEGHGKACFVHSAGGGGKMYVCNLIAAAVCAKGKIVLCVASSGIASLLLSGGCTAHSCFKIPIPIHEASSCNIKKGDVWHELLCQTSLIIWDEVPMQHQNVIECVDHSLHDLLDRDEDFDGITVLFGGDFQQTLPVITHGS